MRFASLPLFLFPPFSMIFMSLISFYRGGLLTEEVQRFLFLFPFLSALSFSLFLVTRSENVFPHFFFLQIGMLTVFSPFPLSFPMSLFPSPCLSIQPGNLSPPLELDWILRDFFPPFTLFVRPSFPADSSFNSSSNFRHTSFFSGCQSQQEKHTPFPPFLSCAPPGKFPLWMYSP